MVDKETVDLELLLSEKFAERTWNMASFILKIANSFLNFLVVVSFLFVGIYAGYALWDNNQVYAAAENVQKDMLKMKPKITNAGTASFEELLLINQDVCAWISIDNTNIDFPVLQGKNNLSYINTDVYGNFSLAGSIFLDSRNDKGFQDKVSLLYGHHMDGGDMFGDLDRFKEKPFFDKNKTGLLILPDRNYQLEIFACLLTNASEKAIFEPQEYKDSLKLLLDLTENQALFYDADTVTELRETEKDAQILILSTCSTEFTDARTILLTKMKPNVSQ